MMATPTSGPDQFNDLAHEFAERYRRGERPPVSEYTAKHPELADEIREFFGAVALVEKLAPAASEPTSGAPSGGRAKAVPPLTLLGDYRILKEIGRGGMGIVFEAEDLAIGRKVALKLLDGPMADDARRRQRFEHEARIAALLQHPNIVPVHSVGRVDDVVAVAIGREIEARLAKRVTPDCVIGGIDNAVVVVVARGRRNEF